ncbi:MAG TPA: hypothetical protein VFF06_36380 [Polyangia bacterium]|nr:hypothetical protein [Polyangia bacterium]
MRLACALVICGLAGCGSDDMTQNDFGAPGADLSASHDLANASGDLASSGDGSSGATLKLENYATWCTVSVNSAPATTANTSGVQSYTFSPGTVVNLNSVAASGTFVWGYWVGTAGDVGAGHDKSMSTTVTMSGDKVVQACCPFANAPNTPCPAPTP